MQTPKFVESPDWHKRELAKARGHGWLNGLWQGFCVGCIVGAIVLDLLAGG